MSMSLEDKESNTDVKRMMVQFVRIRGKGICGKGEVAQASEKENRKGANQKGTQAESERMKNARKIANMLD